MSTKKTPTRPSRKAKTPAPERAPETDARAALAKLAIDPATGEAWPDTTPEWHAYIAAAFTLAAKEFGVPYFEECAAGHMSAAGHLYDQMFGKPL